MEGVATGPCDGGSDQGKRIDFAGLAVLIGQVDGACADEGSRQVHFAENGAMARITYNDDFLAFLTGFGCLRGACERGALEFLQVVGAVHVGKAFVDEFPDFLGHAYVAFFECLGCLEVGDCRVVFFAGHFVDNSAQVA